MPRVPSYDNFQVTPSAPNPGAFVQPRTPSASDIGADQMIRQGAAVGEAADVASRMLTNEMAENTQAIAIGAVNRAKERLYDLTSGPQGFASLKGIAALERPDGVDLATEYTGKFKQAADEIAASLPSDAARRMFSQQAANLGTTLYGQAQQHMVAESVNYRGTVYDGAAANAQRDLALNYTDTSQGGAVDQAITTISSAVRAKARLLGQSQEFADVLVRKATSDAHVLAIGTALEQGNVAFAAGYLQKYGKTMDADDILRAQGLVTKEVENVTGTQAGNMAVQQAAPTIMPRGIDRLSNLVDAVATTESGNRDFNADGSIVTSPKGAKGRMQVMDATNRDPGFGVTPARDDSPAERARVGRDYLQALVKHYGDVPTALAAYNGGPGNVDKAKAEAKRDGTDWLSKMPTETQQYVPTVMGRWDSGGGAPRSMSETEVVQNALRILPPNASQRTKDIATRTSVQTLKRIQSDKKAADDESTANVMRALVANGGQFDALPPSLRSSIPIDDYGKVMDFSKKLATGTDMTNPAVYLRLTDEKYLASLSDNDLYKLRADLSESDWQGFARQRATVLSGKGSSSPGDLNTAAINDTLKNRLASLRIDPTPKDGSKDAERVGAIQRFVRDSLAQAQQQAGKKFTDVETAKHIDKLFATDASFRTTFMGFGTGTDRQSVITLQFNDIPRDALERMRADFKANGVTPSESDLLNTYRRWTVAQAGTKGN